MESVDVIIFVRKGTKLFYKIRIISNKFNICNENGYNFLQIRIEMHFSARFHFTYL